MDRSGLNTGCIILQLHWQFLPDTFAVCICMRDVDDIDICAVFVCAP